MTLLTAHRILIVAAVVFFLYYAVWEFQHRGVSGGLGSSLRVGAAFLAAAALAIYLRTLRGGRPSPDRSDRGGSS